MEPAPAPAVPGIAAHARLSEPIRAFLERPLFLSLATVDPDGAPRQALIWYRLEPDGRILINSRVGRRWPANLVRDGRVAIAIADPDDGYSWVGLTGHVESVVDDEEAALDDIVGLAWRYHPDGPAQSQLDSFRAFCRITFRIAIDGVHDHLED